MKDNYLRIKESAACRLLGSWSFVSTSLAPKHLYLFSFCLFLFFFFSLSLFFFTLLLSSCGLAYPIRLWNKPAKGRLTTPIREDRTANPFHMHYFKWVSCVRRIAVKSVDKLHWLVCKQMSFSSCGDAKTWQTCFALCMRNLICFGVFFLQYVKQ